MDLIRTVEGLREQGQLGPTAGAFGAPDEVLLLSTGPASHLAKHSMIARPPRRRAVVRNRNTRALFLTKQPASSRASVEHGR